MTGITVIDNSSGEIVSTETPLEETPPIAEALEIVEHIDDVIEEAVEEATEELHEELIEEVDESKKDLIAWLDANLKTMLAPLHQEIQNLHLSQTQMAERIMQASSPIPEVSPEQTTTSEMMQETSSSEQTELPQEKSGEESPEALEQVAETVEEAGTAPIKAVREIIRL